MISCTFGDNSGICAGHTLDHIGSIFPNRVFDSGDTLFAMGGASL